MIDVGVLIGSIGLAVPLTKALTKHMPFETQSSRMQSVVRVRTQLDRVVEDYMKKDPLDLTATTEFELAVTQLEDPDAPMPSSYSKFNGYGPGPNPPPRQPRTDDKVKRDAEAQRITEIYRGVNVRLERCNVCGTYVLPEKDGTCRVCAHDQQMKDFQYTRSQMMVKLQQMGIPPHQLGGLHPMDAPYPIEYVPAKLPAKRVAESLSVDEF